MDGSSRRALSPAHRPELALYGRYVVPEWLVDEGFQFHYAKLEDALEELSYEQPPFDGYEEAVATSRSRFSSRREVLGIGHDHFA